MANIIYLTQTHSTNQYLRSHIEAVRNTEEGTVFWTDFQTAGRGQVGNSWESEEKKNLLFSLLLCPSFVPAKLQFIISQISSLAIIDVLNDITENDNLDEKFVIKWPNDIYFKEKKIAGMLIENDLSGQSLFSSIIGIGLNINQKEFKSDAPNPVSLAQITGKEYDREEILISVLTRIFYYYEKVYNGEVQLIKELYYNSLFRRNGLHKYVSEGREFEAEIKEIGLNGMITLKEICGKEYSYAFKEVAFVI